MPTDKNQITIQLRPLVMAGLKAEADKWGMPVKEFIEAHLTMARMHPEGVKLNLPDVAPTPEPLSEPFLPLSGGNGIE